MWNEVSMFVRVFFVIGFLTALALFAFLLGFLLYIVEDKAKQRKLKEVMTEKAVDHIDFSGDAKERIRQEAQELRQITGGEGR